MEGSLERLLEKEAEIIRLLFLAACIDLLVLVSTILIPISVLGADGYLERIILFAPACLAGIVISALYVVLRARQIMAR